MPAFVCRSADIDLGLIFYAGVAEPGLRDQGMTSRGAVCGVKPSLVCRLGGSHSTGTNALMKTD